MEPVESYVTVNGIRTRQWQCGSGTPTLVFIHGVTNSVESWARNVPVLSEKHRVLALDLAGSGRSDKPPMEYSFKTLAAFVKDYLAAVGVSRAVFVGHSLGGGVSLEVAMTWPEIVERLVLVSPAGLVRKMNLFLRLPTVGFLGPLLTHPSRIGTEMGMKSCVYDSSLITPDVVALDYELATLPGAQQAFLSILRRINTLGGLKPEIHNAMLDRLPSVKVPALVVWGKEDKIQPVAGATVAKEKLPAAQVHVFDRCGHMAHFEYPDRFNALVEEFLAQA